MRAGTRGEPQPDRGQRLRGVAWAHRLERTTDCEQHRRDRERAGEHAHGPLGVVSVGSVAGASVVRLACSVVGAVGRRWSDGRCVVRRRRAGGRDLARSVSVASTSLTCGTTLAAVGEGAEHDVEAERAPLLVEEPSAPRPGRGSSAAGRPG